MKKLVILLVILISFGSCKKVGDWLGKSSQRNDDVEKVDDFLKVPDYKPYQPSTSEYIPTYSAPSVPTDSSYWYVILSANGTNWHGTVELSTPYFDFREARRQFGSAEGKGYFDFILQISRESYNTYDNYWEK